VGLVFAVFTVAILSTERPLVSHSRSKAIVGKSPEGVKMTQQTERKRK